ncbi:MAG: hypothetical protein U1E57_07475 [Paenacidovorax caeni]
MPAQQGDLCTLLDEMRLVKDAHELDVMRRAAHISAGAMRAMQASAQMLRAGQEVREYLENRAAARGFAATARSRWPTTASSPPVPTPRAATAPTPPPCALANWC